MAYDGPRGQPARMDARVLAVIDANDGLISRQKLLDLGVGPDAIRSLLRTRRGESRPALHVVRRGYYTTSERWDGLDEYVGRPLLCARAVGLAARRGWVLSHDSACHLQGIPVLRPRESFVHITRPGWTNAWTEYGVKHHLARFNQEQVVEVGGVRALDLARTAVDMGREHGYLRGLVACDAVLRRGVRRDDLERALAIMKYWPGVRDARRAVRSADRGAETVLETLARELVIESGVGEPETQFPVRTVRGVVWCDLRVGNLVVEADGEIKYRSVEDGRVADDPRRAVFDEKVRERDIADRGLVVVRVIYADLWGRHRPEAIARIRRGHVEAVRRFGRDLDPELAAEAAEIRARGDRRPA
ncbi:hypothetical protein NSI01_04990 [Pimelobacter simplex]|nr:hypothetical protein NSI01_04990 [Pimelobacter simplex]